MTRGNTSATKLTTVLLCLSIGGNVILWTRSAHSETDDSNENNHRVDIRGLKAAGSPQQQQQQQDNPLQQQQQQEFCSQFSRWTDHILNPDMDTDWDVWSFKDTVKCPKIDILKHPKARNKVSLNCKTEPKMLISVTTRPESVFSVKFGDECLGKVIDKCCRGNSSVPNVAHYIWYSKRELGFFQFISFMSALRFMKPCLFLIHGDSLPYGKYWDYFVSISPNIIHVQRERPQTVFGKKLAYQEHSSDIMRIEALKLYGGVYLDFDEILLRSVDNFRAYDHTQGHELSYTMGSQFVMSKKNATFLNYWYNSYRDNYKNSWAWNALWVPNNIAKKYPDLIHVEGYNFTRPNWKNVKQIFEENYKWTTNYGMHLYVRWYKKEANIDIIRTLNTTLDSNENNHRVDIRGLKAAGSPQQQQQQQDNPLQQQQQQEFCSQFSRWTDHILNPDMDTDWDVWSFKDSVKCPKIDILKHPKARNKVSLNCKTEPKMLISVTTRPESVFSVKFGDECLGKVIDKCCRGNSSVPNVAHYIWYSKRELGFFQFISFMSALRFMKPCLFLIHGDSLPYGKYWDYFVSISPNIIHVQRERPQTVFGKKLAYQEHSSDIMRIEALKLYGGVYLDFDEILLRSVDNFRAYDHTQGHELSYTMGSQFVMSKKNATFLNYWYNSYRDNYKNSWAWNALWVPNNIAKKYPDLIHVEGYNFTRPNWKNVKQIFEENYKWNTNYGMHLYVRWYKKEANIDIIRTLNTTLGSVCRHILFGNKELCSA